MPTEEATEDIERGIEDREKYDPFARFREFSKRMRPYLRRGDE